MLKIIEIKIIEDYVHYFKIIEIKHLRFVILFGIFCLETEKAVASLEKLWEDSTPAPTIVETGIVANVEIQSEALSGNEAEKPVNEDDDEMALAISSISAICGEGSVVAESAASGREQVLYIEEAVDSEAQQAVAALVFGDDAATSQPADQSQQPIQPVPTQAYRQIENEVPITVVQSSESVDEPVTVTDSVGSVAGTVTITCVVLYIYRLLTQLLVSMLLVIKLVKFLNCNFLALVNRLIL